MEHSEFVVLFGDKRVNLAYDTKKASRVFCNAFPEHGLTWVMQYFMKLRQNTYVLVFLALICLISPFKKLVFIVAMYALLQLISEKVIRRYLEDNMVKNKEFYDTMIRDQVVFTSKKAAHE
ncbi:hypothetical protein D3C87_605190 [compost metagenome]